MKAATEKDDLYIIVNSKIKGYHAPSKDSFSGRFVMKYLKSLLQTKIYV